jgi:outer membrane protein assembly factor BamA
MIGEWQFSCGSEWLKISHLSCAHAQVIDFSCAARDNRVPYLVLEPSWSFSTLDSPQDPTRGFFTHILCKGMFSLDKASPWWLKLWGECSFFCPLTSTIIAGISVRSGSVYHIPLSELIPTERFYLGGSQTLRGYEFGMVPPLNSFVDDDGRRIWVAVGSKTVVSGSAELRFPLYKYVGAVVFTDVGFLKPASFAAATGFGVRCATPVGPLRFDIGWKWKKRSTDDRSYAWFITYGQAF